MLKFMHVIYLEPTGIGVMFLYARPKNGVLV